MGKPQFLTSPANPLLKDVRKAVLRGGLTEAGYWVAEGFHLLEEALRSKLDVRAVLAAQSAQTAVGEHMRLFPNSRVVVLQDSVFRSLATTETSQGVIALVKPPAWTLQELFGSQPLITVLDGLQDPGNAGAVVRSAEAFEATGVVFLKGTVSPYNPKTLRASAGSLFRVPFMNNVDARTLCAALERSGLTLFAAVPHAESAFKSIGDLDLTQKCAVVFGSEAHGVGAELRSKADEISIPTAKVESLNAAVAAAIVLYEARRQRCLKG